MSRPSPADKLLRRLSLLAYLSQHGTVTYADLARHFGVDLQTVVEDVLALWSMNGRPDDDTADFVDFDTDLPEDVEIGTPVDPQVVGRCTVALLQGQNLDRPVPLNTRERMAVALGLRQIAQVLAPLPATHQHLREAVDSVLRALTPHDTTTGATSEDHVETGLLARVTAACQDGRRVRLTYLSPQEERTEREVDPAQVTWEAGRWVLHGWCLRAQAPRSFRLDRTESVEVLQTPVDQRRLRRIDRAGALRGVSDSVRRAGRPVTLRVAPRALWRVEEVPHQDLQRRPDGDIEVSLPVADEAWFAAFLLRLGSRLHAVDPPEAAASAAARARTALAAYESVDAAEFSSQA